MGKISIGNEQLIEKEDLTVYFGGKGQLLRKRTNGNQEVLYNYYEYIKHEIYKILLDKDEKWYFTDTNGNGHYGKDNVHADKFINIEDDTDIFNFAFYYKQDGNKDIYCPAYGTSDSGVFLNGNKIFGDASTQDFSNIAVNKNGNWYATLAKVPGQSGSHSTSKVYKDKVEIFDTGKQNFSLTVDKDDNWYVGTMDGYVYRNKVEYNKVDGKIVCMTTDPSGNVYYISGGNSNSYLGMTGNKIYKNKELIYISEGTLSDIVVNNRGNWFAAEKVNPTGGNGTEINNVLYNGTVLFTIDVTNLPHFNSVNHYSIAVNDQYGCLTGNWEAFHLPQGVKEITKAFSTSKFTNYKEFRDYVLSINGNKTGWLDKNSYSQDFILLFNGKKYFSPDGGTSESADHAIYVDPTYGNLCMILVQDVEANKDVMIGCTEYEKQNYNYFAKPDGQLYISNDNNINGVGNKVNGKRLHMVSEYYPNGIDWHSWDASILNDVVNRPYIKLGYKPVTGGEWLRTNYIKRMGGSKNIRWDILGEAFYLVDGILNGINDVNMLGFHRISDNKEFWLVGQKSAGDRKVPADGELYLKEGSYAGDGAYRKLKDLTPNVGTFAEKRVLTLGINYELGKTRRYDDSFVSMTNTMKSNQDNDDGAEFDSATSGWEYHGIQRGGTATNADRAFTSHWALPGGILVHNFKNYKQVVIDFKVWAKDFEYYGTSGSAEKVNPYIDKILTSTNARENPAPADSVNDQQVVRRDNFRATIYFKTEDNTINLKVEQINRTGNSFRVLRDGPDLDYLQDFAIAYGWENRYRLFISTPDKVAAHGGGEFKTEYSKYPNTSLLCLAVPCYDEKGSGEQGSIIFMHDIKVTLY